MAQSRKGSEAIPAHEENPWFLFKARRAAVSYELREKMKSPFGRMLALIGVMTILGVAFLLLRPAPNHFLFWALLLPGIAVNLGYMVLSVIFKPRERLFLSLAIAHPVPFW